MNTKILLICTAAVLAMASPLTTQAAPQVYDLSTDWSDTQNPNGTWSYLSPYLQPLSDTPIAWTDPIAGSILTETKAADAVPGVLEVGDVYAIADDGALAPSVRWTAPADGTVDLSGSVWNTSGPWAQIVAWQLNLNDPNGRPFSYGDSQGSSRSAPADFSTGENGPNALLNIPVQAGDQVYLHLVDFSLPEPFGIEFTVTFTPDVVDPVSAIEDLALAVVAMNLQNGIENSLDSKLDAALNALDDVNENNDGAACNALGAFSGAVEAQRGNKLTDAQADQLIAAAQEIQGLLNCGN